MNAKPALSRPPAVAVAVAATLATLISIGVLGAVSGLFHSRGLPMEQAAAAERACVSHIYVSERESCMHDWLAAVQAQSVASK